MLWWGLVGLLLGAVLTGCSRFLVLRMNMLDVPGERSSHSQATPRGGGLSIVFASMLGVFLLPAGMLTAVIIPSLTIAAVGFWDDYRQASRRLRLAVQFVAALLAVMYVQPESLDLAGVRIGGVLLLILLVVWYVWCTNLYNFMDGINGIAGAQAVSVLMSILLLTLLGGSDGGIGEGDLGGIAGLHGHDATDEFIFLMAGACAGFLIWNFPKAHIFMGDAGSAFLGALFAGLSVYFIDHQPELFWALMIVIGVFVVDSTVTLVNRARLRQRIFDAHRSHAYQNASRLLASHTKVTLLVLLINVIWLLPWAFVAVEQMVPGVIALVLAYVPLLIAAIYLKAGVPEKA